MSLLVLNSQVVDQALNDWAVTDDFGHIVFHSEDDVYGFLDDIITGLKELDASHD